MSPYSVRMQDNTYQNNSKYGHFLRSVLCSLAVSYIHLTQYMCLLRKLFNAWCPLKGKTYLKKSAAESCKYDLSVDTICYLIHPFKSIIYVIILFLFSASNKDVCKPITSLYFFIQRISLFFAL